MQTIPPIVHALQAGFIALSFCIGFWSSTEIF